MRNRPTDNENERGAVLLTTLLLMTIMAAITVSIVDNIRFSIRRTANLQMQAQLDWYARGGEAFSQNLLKTYSGQQSKLAQMIVAQVPVEFPFEDGGIRILIHDANNCFNLNTLADEKNAQQNRKNFERLLGVLDFDASDATKLSSSIQDWVDTDNIPGPAGAESLEYSNISPPYKAANRLMIDVSELRAIAGISEVIYQRLAPFVCSYDNTDLPRLNLNTLKPEQAPLLANVLGGAEGLVAAKEVIAGRPLAGYGSVDQVWNMQSIQDLELKGSGKGQVTVTSDMVRLDIIVQYQDQVRKQVSTFEIGGVNDARLVSRRRVY
ncbi:MAG: type II secretion system minor pseudopilin GspK [Robiginitomaculum sp.]|nr:type II secretion system minor pseudopilin GspK [Robiginitomaculum sp.]